MYASVYFSKLHATSGVWIHEREEQDGVERYVILHGFHGKKLTFIGMRVFLIHLGRSQLCVLI
jgi:hypothetical protein